MVQSITEEVTYKNMDVEFTLSVPESPVLKSIDYSHNVLPIVEEIVYT